MLHLKDRDDFNWAACINPLSDTFIPCGVCVQGLATAFFSDSDAGIARSLMETLSETNQTVPGWLQNFASRMPGYGGGKGRRGGGRFGGRDARKEYGGGGYGAPAAGGYGGQAGGGYGGGGYGGGGRGGGGGGGYGGGGQNCELHYICLLRRRASQLCVPSFNLILH